MTRLMAVAALALVVNLPFGYWRVSARRFSAPWFLAVHLPIPLVAGMRLLSGLGWRLSTFPVMVGAYFLGQYLGGKLNRGGRRSIEQTAQRRLPSRPGAIVNGKET